MPQSVCEKCSPSEAPYASSSNALHGGAVRSKPDAIEEACQCGNNKGEEMKKKGEGEVNAASTTLENDPYNTSINNKFVNNIQEKFPKEVCEAAKEKMGDGSAKPFPSQRLPDFCKQNEFSPKFGLRVVGIHNSSFRRSAHLPSSVHRLRLGDIDVLVTMGDSMMTGYKAVDHQGFSKEYFFKNLWICGDGEGLETSFTFGNLLKALNPRVRGISSGIAPTDKESMEIRKNNVFDRALCVAQGGKKAEDLVRQARLTASRLQEDGVEAKDMWAMVVIFVGMNDFGYLAFHNLSKEATEVDDFKAQIVEAIEILKEHLPRCLVVLVSQPGSEFMLEATHTAKFNQKKGPPNLCNARDDFLKMINNALYEIDKEYSGDDQFSVVISNFWEDVRTPALKANGEPNLGFYAEDVFHPSRCGNSVMAKLFTENLFEEVGKKNKRANFATAATTDLRLPDEKMPFIRTLDNSK